MARFRASSTSTASPGTAATSGSPGAKSSPPSILQAESWCASSTSRPTPGPLSTANISGRSPKTGSRRWTPRRAACWAAFPRRHKVHQVDANTGAILRTIESDRFVTGVSWVDGELWHATMEGEQSEIRRVDPENGEVLERLEMPAGITVSGLEADGKDLFFCGGATSGKVRAVRRPTARTQR